MGHINLNTTTISGGFDFVPGYEIASEIMTGIRSLGDRKNFFPIHFKFQPKIGVIK